MTTPPMELANIIESFDHLTMCDEGLSDMQRLDSFDRDLILSALRAAPDAADAGAFTLPKSLPLEGFSNHVEYAPVIVRGSSPADAGLGLSREEIARAIQQFWQGPSGRPWDGSEDSCCEKLPAQADWFRRLADALLSQRPALQTS